MISASALTRAAILILAAGLITACGGGGGGSTEPSVTLEGAVVDGYVRGATVTLYGAESFGAPTAIASGTTDENGDFVLNLPESDLPAHIGLLSKGGTVIDTGLAAPTMAMVALRDQNRYYVTPLTDSVVWQGYRPGSSFVAAEGDLAAELGLPEAELYGDPLSADAPAGLVNGLHRALASGEQSTALADGHYHLSLVYLDKNNMGSVVTGINDLLTNNQLSGDLTISDGTVTGTLDGGDTITGRIQGPDLVLSAHYPGGDGVTRVAGTVGVLGSLSGSYVEYDATGANPVLSSGVFVASLIPDSGVNASAFKTAAEQIYAGNRNALFRDLYGDRDLAWGAVGNVAVDTTANTVTTDNFAIRLNGEAGPTDTITFKEGDLLTLSDGTTPSGLAAMRFEDSSGDYAYLVQALGNRRGIYVAGDGTTGNYAIGESYLARRDALGNSAVSASSGKTLSLAITTISPHTLGTTRDPNSFVETSTIDVPTLTNATGASGSATTSGGVLTVSGSMVGLKDSSSGPTNDQIDDANDFLALAELHATGALQGDIAEGGTLLGGAIDAADWPVPLAGFVTPQGTDTSLLQLGEVQLDFLARPLYTVDLATNTLASLNDYGLIITGTIQSTGRNAATLSYRDSQDETGTLNLSVENLAGIYHLQGPMGTEYIDILWPAGGSRAVFVSSTAADGNGKIYEIGEAFINY